MPTSDVVMEGKGKQGNSQGIEARIIKKSPRRPSSGLEGRQLGGLTKCFCYNFCSEELHCCYKPLTVAFLILSFPK
jgi:hypothetical protein